MNRILAAAALVGGLLLAGCALHDDFVKAQNANTVDAWGSFVKKYPLKDNPNCPECTTADRTYKDLLGRDTADWNAAQNAGTVSAYLDFLDSHGSSPNAGAAVDAARALLAKGQGGEEDFVRFLEKFPDDPKSSEVRRGLQDLRAAAVKEGRAPEACDLFLAEYPGTEGAGRLRATCEKFAFEGAKKMRTRLALEFFLKRYPDSSRADAVQEMLSGLPHSALPASDADFVALIPKIRESSRDLRAQECLGALADAVRASGDPLSAAAEKARAEYLSSAQGGDGDLCRRRFVVPASARATVAAAVQALATTYQRQSRLAAAFDMTERLAAKAREIGGTSAQLAEESEAFDLEMQAYYGFMPADPDKPQEKASKSAKEAERRARRAFEITQSGSIAAKKAQAAEVLRLMDDQAKLLTKIIAFYEKPERRAQ